MVSIPWYDAGATLSALSFCESVAETVPAFELHFAREGDAAPLLRELA